MTVRGKVLLSLGVALGLIALQGAAQYQGTTRGKLARRWSLLSTEQSLLYLQLRGDALLYLESLQRARRAGEPTATVLAERRRLLEASFAQLHAFAQTEAHWLNTPRPEERQRISQLERALLHWMERTEARFQGPPVALSPGQQESLEAYQADVEPLLTAALEQESAELKELSRQGERSLEIGQTLSLVIPLIALGVMLSLSAATLVPMNRRLRELLASAERMGRGEHEQELPDTRRDEFGTLARAFNQMGRELRATQARLIFADRLATMGRLSAGVGHEINNPLSYVLNNLQYAHQALSQKREALPAEEWRDVLEALADAREGAERVSFIVKDLKALSRADDASLGRVELATVVRGAARMASHELATRARLVEDCGQVPPVLGNPARLGQVFLNLLINAAQAMPPGKVEENEIRVVARQEAPGHVTVEVRDTGCGIPPEHLARIFEPFFTTKPAGQGTGLGLAVCHDIITASGGTLGVESEPGRGTTFRITLPVAPPAAAS